jgi:hypothetical protein
MRHVSLLLATLLTLVALNARADDAEAQKPIPDDCPVTIPVEPRYIPPPPHKAPESGSMFLHGSDALYTQLYSDGRWHGLKSANGTRNKLFWYRKNAEWLEEFPYQLTVTAKRIDADEPMIAFPRVNNAVMGKEVAMLLALELRPGCWEVTGNYKSDYLSFVVWVD